jgi:hypothetical protein
LTTCKAKNFPGYADNFLEQNFNSLMPQVSGDQPFLSRGTQVGITAVDFE